MAIKLKGSDSIKLLESNNNKSAKTSRKKLILISVSKNEDRELYEFQKQQEFLPILFKILLELGFNKEKEMAFDKADFHLQYFFGISHDGDEITHEDYYKDPFSKEYLKIEEFRDSFHTIYNDKFDIEVIIFTSKIYLIT